MHTYKCTSTHTYECISNAQSRTETYTCSAHEWMHMNAHIWMHMHAYIDECTSDAEYRSETYKCIHMNARECTHMNAKNCVNLHVQKHLCTYKYECTRMHTNSYIWMHIWCWVTNWYIWMRTCDAHELSQMNAQQSQTDTCECTASDELSLHFDFFFEVCTGFCGSAQCFFDGYKPPVREVWTGHIWLCIQLFIYTPKEPYAEIWLFWSVYTALLSGGMALLEVIYGSFELRYGSVGVLHTATHCNTLQQIGLYYNTLEHTTTHRYTRQHTAEHYKTLHHVATHCSTLKHITPHCNTPQHTAAYCGRL